METGPIIADPSCQDEHDPSSLSVAEAQRRILEAVRPVRGTETCALRATLDRVLAEPVRSRIDVPAHTNSAMDGYAVRASDVAAAGEHRLQVAGDSFAGHPYREPVGAGQCVRIMTGAVLPEGTDTVVIQEEVAAEGDTIRLDGGRRSGDNVRAAGEDIAAGDLVLERGHRIGPADLGLLASLGLVELRVHRRLRVAFFSTGDELRSLGEPLAPGDIYDSNRYTLYAMLSHLGCELVDMGVVVDEPEAVRQAFLDAAACADVIISSGGVSVGEADYIKAMLNEVGSTAFWKVAMKPGRPLAFGRVGEAGFFGLPGNPVSVMVTFYQFVKPALAVMQGAQPALPMTVEAVTESRLKKRPGRTEFQRGILDRDEAGRLRVRRTGAQGSGILRSMSQGNCFIVLDDACAGVEPGETVTVQPFAGLV